jgi:hypothetical protein
MSDEFDTMVSRLRPGTAVEVEHLADLVHSGPRNLAELRRRLAAIHAKRCYVLEKSTGRRSDGKRGWEMVLDASNGLRKGLPSDVAKKNGSKGGAPRKERSMPPEKAEIHWRSLKHPTDKIALDHMTGWNKTAARRAFGNSGRPGRRKKK